MPSRLALPGPQTISKENGRPAAEKPPGPSPCSSPSIERTMIRPSARQWTVCGPGQLRFGDHLGRLDHLVHRRAARGVGHIRRCGCEPETRPGMIRSDRTRTRGNCRPVARPRAGLRRRRSGIGSSCTIRPSSVSTTARKSGASTPVPSCRQARYRIFLRRRLHRLLRCVVKRRTIVGHGNTSLAAALIQMTKAFD